MLLELAERLEKLGFVSDSRQVAARLMEREQLGSTGIGRGIAIPHCKVESLKESILALGIAPDGVEFEAGDGLPVQIFFLLISPAVAAAQHLQTLAAISRWVRSGGEVQAILDLSDVAAIYQYFCASDD